MKLLPAVSALVLLVSCTQPRVTEPIPEAPRPARPAPSAQPAVVTAARAFDESLLRGREFLLEGSNAAAVRDPVLGPLAADAAGDAARAFLTDALQGTVDPARLIPRWSDYLTSWVRSTKASGLTGTVRVGASADDQGGRMVPVRVFGGGKEASGWVFVVAGSGGWLISDVQLSERTALPALWDPEVPLR